MGISEVNRSTQTGATDTVATPKNGSIDREAFLKLLVAQISHQDPLQPMQGTEFVAQLSQFAMVEQSLAQSQKLDLLSAQLRGISYNEATTLVGKSVTVQGSGLAFDGVTSTSASVSIEAPAQKVTVTIRDASGRAVRTMELGPRAAGALPITWDGRDDNGQPLPKGAYQFAVDATDGAGQAVSVSKRVTGIVRSVSFEKGYPELLLDSGVSAAISDLVNVADAPPSKK
jgi:flagellar basal-body rod modification protein FlgD